MKKYAMFLALMAALFAPVSAFAHRSPKPKVPDNIPNWTCWSGWDWKGWEAKQKEKWDHGYVYLDGQRYVHKNDIKHISDKVRFENKDVIGLLDQYGWPEDKSQRAIADTSPKVARNMHPRPWDKPGKGGRPHRPGNPGGYPEKENDYAMAKREPGKPHRPGNPGGKPERSDHGCLPLA